MRRKGNLHALLLVMQNGADTMENSTEVPKEIKIELPYNPAMLLLDIYPKRKH